MKTQRFTAFLPARRCAICAVYLPSSCVCVSVRLSQVGVLLRRLSLGIRKQRHAIAQGLQFSGAKNIGEIPKGSKRVTPNGSIKQRLGSE